MIAQSDLLRVVCGDLGLGGKVFLLHRLWMKNMQVRGLVWLSRAACPQRCPKGCTQVGGSSPQVSRRRPHPLWITALVWAARSPTVVPSPDAIRAPRADRGT